MRVCMVYGVYVWCTECVLGSTLVYFGRDYNDITTN